MVERHNQRLEREMVEQAQLQRVMEESKKEALRRGQVVNPDSLTYEVGEAMRTLGAPRADRESREGQQGAVTVPNRCKRRLTVAHFTITEKI